MTEDAKLLDYLKRATTELRQTRRKLRDAEARGREPLAIVAMSCRFPGGVESPEDLWDLVATGGDAISGFPTDRGWDLEALYDPDPERSGTSYVREGGFLPDAGDFDAELFGISPREALSMDPQQRLLLETSWQLFERAGLDPHGLAGTRVGVFVGTNGQDYAHRAGADPQEDEGYSLTGNAASVASGRVSYAFGLEGPAVTVDTACSSSLVAMHLAAQALRSGECSMALAGGVSVMTTPRTFVQFSRQRGLSPDGRCKAFAAAADGTGWGEGVGLVLLERLSDAVANGHRVLGVLRGSAVNQDGASNGLTAPNGPSQQRVIRQALASAGLSVGDVDVVEAHGTGTRLGDPIEAQALLATYGQDRPEGRPLWLGSVKSNIGHTQAAAGVAGVIKMVMAMRHGLMPETLHVDVPSSHVDWSAGDVRLLTEPVAWSGEERVRRAGVSSFGVSGTNAHVVIEEPPAAEARTVQDTAPEQTGVEGPLAWLVSGRGDAGLRGQAARLAEFVRSSGDVDVAGVAATLLNRAPLEDRAVVVGEGVAELVAGLDALVEGGSVDGLVTGSPVAGKTAVLFTGQGSQFAGMGAELCERFESFAAVVDEVCAVADELLPEPLRPVLFGEGGRGDLIDRTEFAQVGLVALEVGLWKVLSESGLRADVLVGHSVGEISAAVAAGVLSLPDAVRLACARGRLMQAMPAGGVMTSVAAPVEEVRERIDGRAGVWIAAVNASGSVVLAGEADAVRGVVEELEADGVRTRALPVSHAFHTPLMDPMLGDFSTAVEDLAFGPAEIPVVSTVTGDVAGADFGSPAYWVRHVRKPVRFAEAVSRARELGARVWVEVGPQPALSAAIEEREGEAVASFMRRDRDQVTGVLTGLARLHVHGVEVDWDRWVPRTRELPDLPTYAFQRRRYWLEASAASVSAPDADPGTAEFWQAVERNDLEALGLDEDTPSSALLPTLSAWRHGRQERQTLADWHYRVTWKPLPEPATAASLTGTWLVVGHDESAPAPLAALVDGLGARAEVLTVAPGTGRAALADRLRTVSENAPSLSGVLSALALPGGGAPGDWHATADTLALIQALGDAGVTAPLWCLTGGAVGTDGDEPVRAPEAAAVWGLGRVAALEHPDRWGGLIDLPADPDASAYRRLGFVLTGATGEDQVAVRATGILACRLRRADAAAVRGDDSDRSPVGTTLITGGTGALGGQVARRLAERGAEHLVLLSRQGPDAPGAEDLRRDLEALGSRVTLRACDISRRTELAAAIAAVPAAYPVTTVVHAAAVLDDAPLSALTPERLASVLDAKATSARYLDELTRDLPVASFVLFSAFGGVLGSAGQGNYAAANAVLDALADQRRAAGLPATSIAWGAWAGDGMAARSAATVLRLRRTGARPMEPGLALAALGRALGNGATNVLVADIDWSRFTPAYTAVRPSMLLADLPDARAALAPNGEPTADGTGPALPEAARRLAALSGTERHTALLDLVRGQVAAVLGHRDPTAIGSERPFRELGFDSLTGLDLRNRLTVATGLALPATLVFDHPTVGQLTARIDTELGGADDTPHTQAQAQARARAEAGESSGPAAPGPDRDEPIAIVAVACRLPGGVRSPEDLWSLLADGVDAMSEFPTDRGWDLSRLYAPETDGPGTSYVRHGGFLSDAAGFDAGFFGIGPREALAMDPQQRQLLETSWEVLERAGIDPQSLRGSRTGVFAGTNGQDYADLLTDVPDGEDFAATGNAASVLSGRVAYALGLEGPAVTVDTACSASLVGIHLASQALRRQECSLALAGGVTVMSTPRAFVSFSRQRGLAPDGRCKPFSAGADGTAWGEGVAVLLLERLSDARRNGHPVLAVIRGSAVNQDGASNGLTAPNGPSQQRVIRAALADGALTPADVDAVEAHGTGTVLGDPIEAQALIAAYGDRPADRPLRIGSIKSNIGHTQAAAGAAGVIKMVLALQHRLLPKTLHAEEASPHVDWSAGEVSLLTEAAPWDRDDRPRRAGVSSFGVSGTNAHVVIEEAPEPFPGPEPLAVSAPVEAAASDVRPAETRPGGVPPAEPLPVLLSARDDATVAAQAARLHAHLTAHPDLTLPDVAHALATTRAALEHRAVVLAPDRDELLGTLAALADGAPTPAALRGTAGAGRVAVLFPGQGSQSVGMGRALYGRHPAFAACLDEVCAAFAPELERPLLDVLHAEPGTPEADLLDRTEYTQPALFAVETALYRLLEGWGLRPDYLLGHSIGELTAAHVAGVLTLPEAARLVAARGRLMQALPEGGAMLAVALAPEDLAPLLDGHRHRVDIAAVNGPAATVLSGDEEAVLDIAARCTERGVKNRRLNVSHAFHSRRMDGMLADFGDLAGELDLAPARIPIVSNVTGTALTADEATAPEYWVRHVRETVRFHDGIRWLHSRGVTVFLELGPDGVLSAMGAGCLPDVPDQVAFVPALRASWPEPRAVTAALGELHTRGVPLDWPTIATGWGGRPVPLPTYPFRRRRYWPDATPARVPAADPADTRFWNAVTRQDITSLTDELGVAETAALPELLPALSAWRERRHTESALQEWRYRISWRRLTDLPPPRPTGTWIVVASSAPEAAAGTTGVLAALARCGARAHLVTVGPDGDAVADTGVHADAGAALRAALGATDTAPAGVLSLLALDGRPHPGRSELTMGLAGTVRLIQTLAEADGEAGAAAEAAAGVGVGVGTRLWCVTRGAVAADRTEAVTDPAQAQVWGLGRVAALEHPRRWGGLADLPAEPDDTDYDRLCAVVVTGGARQTGSTGRTGDAGRIGGADQTGGAGRTGGAGEDQVAIRPGGVLGRRLIRAAAPAPAPSADGGWQPRGTVLITGGTGGIGAHVARRLAAEGAEHLVLVSRSGADGAEAARLVAELGARVTVAACDVTDRRAVTELVARVSAEGHPIRSVLHAAGISRHAALADTTPDEIADTLAAKTAGAAVLHEVFEDTELDAFVLFSSIAGVWGSGGQAAYAAANAYLDALAEHRRARGLPATSVAWGAWAGVGMATVGDAAERLRSRGITVMDPDRAVAALRRAVAEDEPQVTVADVDWDRFVPLFTGARPSRLLDELPEAVALFTDTPADAAPVADGLGRQVAALPEADGVRLLLDLVRAEAAAVLGHADADEVDADRAFRSLGFDSLGSVQLRDRLVAALGTPLPATLVFDHPNPALLAAHLRDTLLGVRPEQPQTGPAGPAGQSGQGGRVRSADGVGDGDADDPIVIVGMGCRFPGRVESPDQLWDLVAAGGDAISGFPTDRGWDLDALYDPDPEHNGTSYAREGGFLADAGAFDAGFFGISPREALAMDPQQRLLLEVTWEALERGGIAPDSLRTSPTGVFMGTSGQDYMSLSADASSEGYFLTGNAASVVSGRLAYVFGLEGPAVTVDTACSSSLVAMHLAAQALRAGECSLALAGGATVMSTPAGFVEFSRQRGLAPDGRCKPFATAADGTGWAEGAGVLLLEKLSDARRHGHRVLGVLRGSAVNQDGASNGLTAPNGPSQQRVIRQALANAGLSAGDVDVVEGHGTGTRLGDPIEAQALLATYGQGRSEGRPLWLGSVKSNIGHTQAAAGVAGVIKMLMAMRHEQLPGTLHVDEPSSHVDWSAGDVRLLTRALPWSGAGGPRRAGVSSFGVSGTNAHLILEEPPAAEPAGAVSLPVSRSVSVPGPVPWLVSGRGEAGLRGQGARLAEFVREQDAVDVAEVASVLADRTAWDDRAVVVGTGAVELAVGLEALAEGVAADGLVTGSRVAGKTAVLFTGQGSQFAGMGAQLYERFESFAAVVDEVCAVADELLPEPLRPVLFGEDGRRDLIDRTEFAQVGLVALEVGLWKVLSESGVRADVLVGHSVGEISAAVAAGVLSLPDAVRLACARGRLMQGMAPGGVMASVAAAVEDVQERIAGVTGVWVAAVNAPGSVVLAGEADAVRGVVEKLEADGVRTRSLPVSHAFHTPLMDPMLGDFSDAVAGLAFVPAEIPVVSTVSGELAGPDFGSPAYWVQHARQPVRFADAVDRARELGVRMWAEVGPQPALSAAMEERPGEAAVSFMRRDRDQVTGVLTGLARLHVHGVGVDWNRWVPRATGSVDVPTYAFQRRRYWAAGSAGASAGSLAGTGLEPAGHRLLGAQVALADGGVVFTGRLSVSGQPWLADHAVSGVVVLPGTGFVDLVVHAGLQVGCARVEELTLQAPLVLSEDGPGVTVQVVVEEPDEYGRRGVSVHSRPDAGEGGWTRHGVGVLTEMADVLEADWAWPPAGDELAAEDVYAGLADAGFDYGPVFRGLQRVWRVGEDMYAEVVLPDEPSGFALHPALLDAVLHALAVVPESGEGGLPFAFTGVTVHRTGARTLHARLRRGADGVRVEAVDPAGQPVVTVESLSLRPVSEAALHSNQDVPLRMRWDQVAVVPEGLPSHPGDCALVSAGQHHAVADVVRAVDEGATVPAWVLLDLPHTAAGSVPERTRAATEWVLLQLQTFLAAPVLADTRMVIRTNRAVVTGPGDRSVDPAVAAVWGLVRSAVAENPDRLHLVDTDTDTGTDTGTGTGTDTGVGNGEVSVGGLLVAIREANREQVALRKGVLLAPRLVPIEDDVLSVPEGASWRLTPGGQTLEGLSLVADPAAPEGLAPGQVRVAVRAAGLNFRDVMVALGMYPGRAALGAEGAGVVTEVGPEVAGTAVGDRVFGLLPECFGPSAVTDARTLAAVPEDWSFTEAASVPIVFLTAWYALRDLADLRPGERVLIHAGAGGVGMAAIQLAHHLGAEVFATAHPTKWGALRALGVAEDHMASSRDLGFRTRFAALTEEGGVDVVLNSLAGEFVDASLELLPRGGRFIEMGKTDVRAEGEIPAGVTYRTFDLADPEPERIGAMLSEVVDLLRRGAMDLLPITSWDIREAPAAFRHLGQAKHTGKLVLTVPAPLDPAGTVLVTGGTGTLGSLLARHLVAEYGVRHLLLTGRQGPAAPGAAELVEELRQSGAEARVVACDLSRRDEVAALLDGVDPHHPLTGVLHAAGVVDDAVIGSLDPQRLAAVLAAKADSAWHLHELTREADLAMFTLFSSAAGVLGAPGQGNYAAANTFLDALAEHRRTRGLPAQSHSWGLWAQRSGISGHLGEGDLARISASGMVPLSTEAGLRLWDRAGARTDQPHLALLQLRPRHRHTHPLLAGPAAPERVPRARAAAAVGQTEARDRLATLPAGERRRVLIGLVREHAAAVLGHPSVETVEDERAFKDLGFDSLTGIELRNRLNAATGVSLRPTLVFDHPTPQLLAEYLDRQVTAGSAAAGTTTTGGVAGTVEDPLTENHPHENSHENPHGNHPAAGGPGGDGLTEAAFRRMLDAIPFRTLQEAGLTGPLLRLARGGDGGPSAGPEERPREIDAMDADDLIRIALDTFED
ncbi:SDR family NAD(P)-dependent oxidoreductase [Streptomyces sp. MBT42]|uniref:type I polyketide synthase n=1 Tax=Streptomyces sp. MBT42 TaxID=1488373 RepID=UPI001E5ED210|nr:type I polyketide synthase [Streptomyces sp. MBT42]MCD2462692.1 SDR family NAD(P)-dependent oxidoreductase [Streptomyces sp. MBT42]